MTWACLDDGFHQDPRQLDAGIAASGLYARATCYVALYRLDGVIPRNALVRLLDDGDAAPLDALLRVGLLTETDGSYTLADYFGKGRGGNLTREQIEKNERERKARAESAARSRWGKSRDKTAPAEQQDDSDDYIDI